MVDPAVTICNDFAGGSSEVGSMHSWKEIPAERNLKEESCTRKQSEACRANQESGFGRYTSKAYRKMIATTPYIRSNQKPYQSAYPSIMPIIAMTHPIGPGPLLSAMDVTL